MAWLDWLPLGSVPEISPEALAHELRALEPPLVIDVRSALEFHRGHVANAVHVPVHALRRRLPSLQLQPEISIVVVCKTAHRSIPAVRLLAARGFRAAQLAGGMDRWRACGLPIVRGDDA